MYVDVASCVVLPHQLPYSFFSFLALQCHRMVTVRELARSQGFPDSFVFYSINDNVVTVRRTRVPFPPFFERHVMFFVFSPPKTRCTDKSETQFLGPLLRLLGVNCARHD